jgi:hypothetical protein
MSDIKTTSSELDDAMKEYENIYKPKKEPKYGKLNYDKIAKLEGVDVEEIRGKSFREIIEYLAMIQKADGGRVGFKKGGWDPGAGRDERDLIGPYPTDVGLGALSKYGYLDATVGIEDLLAGEINPTITADTAFGPVNVKGTYSDDEQTLGAHFNKGPFSANITYNAITGEPEYWAGYSETFKDGGRIGFVDGGWADDLTGPGLALYNSMTAGGHSDQAIQDTLTELGYWGGDATGIETIVNTQPIITQGGGGNGGGGGGGDEDLGYAGLGMSPGALGGKLPGFANWGKRTLGDISYAYSKIPSISKVFGWAGNQISDWNDARKEKKEAKLQAEIDAANKAALASIVEANIATYGTENRPNTGINEPGGGKGQSPTGGDIRGTPFDEGGLATMFTRRR